jgi:hypothetical protein
MRQTGLLYAVQTGILNAASRPPFMPCMQASPMQASHAVQRDIFLCNRQASSHAIQIVVVSCITDKLTIIQQAGLLSCSADRHPPKKQAGLLMLF